MGPDKLRLFDATKGTLKPVYLRVRILEAGLEAEPAARGLVLRLVLDLVLALDLALDLVLR